MGATSKDLDERARAVLAAPPVAVTDPGDAPWLRALGGGAELARLIDHTLLKPEATGADVGRLADEGRGFGVAAVCVNGVWTRLVSGRLAGCGVATAAVVGFPLGAMSPKAKAGETALAVADGAGEIDMVISLGHALAGEWEAALADVRAVVEAADGCGVKVILETAALTPESIVKAALIAVDGGARFVKTSTGFHPAGGASVEAVELMRRAVGLALGVKASGGVRTADAARRMLAAGADRLGTSSTAAMLSA